jgi:hypothetical protein
LSKNSNNSVSSIKKIISIGYTKTNKGNCFWQQSQGSLEALRKYIDMHSSHTYTADYLEKLLEQAQKHRMMLISDIAGMGKSTVLTQLRKSNKIPCQMGGENLLKWPHRCTRGTVRTDWYRESD